HHGAHRFSAALELAAPLALGQRGLVIAPQRSGATTILQWFGRAIRESVPEASILVVLVDRPVEEHLEWREAVDGAMIHGTSSEHDAAEHAALSSVFDDAARAAQSGSDVVVLVDSLAALAR